MYIVAVCVYTHIQNTTLCAFLEHLEWIALVNKSKDSRILQMLDSCTGWWCKYVNKGNIMCVCEEWKYVEEGRGGWLKIAEFKTSTEFLSQPGDVTMATNSLTVTIKIYYSFESSQKGKYAFCWGVWWKMGQKRGMVLKISLVILQREQLLPSTVVTRLINMVSSHNTWELWKKVRICPSV